MIPAIIAVLEVLADIAGILFGLAKTLAALAAIVGLFELLFDPKGAQRVGQFVANIVRGALGIATPLLNEVEGTLAPVVTAFTDAMQANGGALRSLLDTPLRDFAAGALTTAQQSLTGKTNIKPGDQIPIAATAFADAVAFGVGSFAVSAAFEAVFPEKLNTLNSLGPMLATLSGFEEITTAALRPLFYAGIAQPARYDANSKFRSLLPDLMTARILLSRRLITVDQFNTLAGYAGMSPDWMLQQVAMSYRPLQPRMLATAIQDTPFPTAQIQAALQDNGLSDTNVTLMLQILEYNSTKNVRNAYITEAITAYGDGVVSDAELNSILTAQGWSNDAITFATNRALIARRIKLATEVSAQVVSLVTAGLLTPEEGLQQLETAGVVDWQANLKITLATTKAELQQARKAAAAERKVEVMRQRNLTRAAIAEYERGAIDSVGLTTALEALGLDLTLIASVVAVETAKRAGKLKFVYGQFLTPESAKVLTTKVGALRAQFVASQITDADAAAQLSNLGVPDDYSKALQAEWSAAKPITTTVGPKLPI